MITPLITANFILDSEGNPKAIQSGEVKHYQIQIQVENAPQDTYAVTYELHPTYYEPVRESIQREENFAEKLTSYGDYLIRAKVRSKTGTQTVVTPLSTALTLGHPSAPSSPIGEALEHIRKR